MSWDIEQFKKDVATHQMTILRDEGVYRHLRFQTPGSYCMGFDIVTWPGYLAYTGDMGAYVFTRLEDMFQFFRHDDGPNKYRIDLRYWAEKCECGGAADRSGIREFSKEKFERNVKEYLIEWIRNHRDNTNKEERRELWSEVKDCVIDIDGDGGGYRQRLAAHDFTHRLNNKACFYFQDFFERNSDVFTFSFEWCCHALRWAINVYDQSRNAQASP